MRLGRETEVNARSQKQDYKGSGGQAKSAFFPSLNLFIFFLYLFALSGWLSRNYRPRMVLYFFF